MIDQYGTVHRVVIVTTEKIAPRKYRNTVRFEGMVVGRSTVTADSEGGARSWGRAMAGKVIEKITGEG